MKTCTNCHAKKKNADFIEHCGDVKIENLMCQTCRENARITPEQAKSLIQHIAKKVL
jgi:hypothetical protein